MQKNTTLAISEIAPILAYRTLYDTSFGPVKSVGLDAWPGRVALARLFFARNEPEDLVPRSYPSPDHRSDLYVPPALVGTSINVCPGFLFLRPRCLFN